MLKELAVTYTLHRKQEQLAAVIRSRGPIFFVVIKLYPNKRNTAPYASLAVNESTQLKLNYGPRKGRKQKPVTGTGESICPILEE